MCKGVIYAATKSGKLWKIDVNGQYSEISSSGGWENTKVMVTCAGKVYAYVDSIMRIDPETNKVEAVASGWGGTIAACAIGDEMWVATKSGNIWKVKTDGSSTKIYSDGWNETKQLVALKGKVYAFVNALWIIDPVTNKYEKISL